MKRYLRRSLGVLMLDGERLVAVLLSRRGRQYRTDSQAVLQLHANLLGDAPEVVASDLSSQLREHGIHQRHWLLAIPASWLAMTRVALPAGIGAGEIPEYAWLQAEQQLSVSPEQTALAYSVRPGVDSDTGWVTLFALKTERLERLQSVCRSAHLQVDGVLPAMMLAPGAAAGVAVATLSVFPGMVTLQVTHDDALLLLRECPLGQESAAGESPGALPQAVRIALAQLPPRVRESLRRIDLVGDTRLCARLQEYWQGTGAAAALPPLTHTMNGEEGRSRIAESLVQIHAMGSPTLAFSRRVQRSAQARFHRGVWRYALPLLLVLLLAAAWLLLDLLRTRSLERRAAALRPERERIEQVRTQVRTLSTWYDQTPVALEILRTVTEAFPEQGSVWVTGLTISDGNSINLVGKAADSAAWLRMQETLRQSPSVADLRVSQIRTERTESQVISFVISFNWSRKAAS